MTRRPETLAARLKVAREARHLSQADLARLTELKQPDISKIETGRILKTTGIGRLAAVLGVSSMWLELGADPEPDFILSAQAPRVYGVSIAQPHTVRETPPRLYWGEITTMLSLPAAFETELPDNAMAHAPLPCPKGTVVTFRRHQGPPPVGEAVLVRCKRGQVYFRECRAKLDGGWIAHAYGAAFPSLDSAADELQILGVFDGLRAPWSQLAG